jgi:hypothetical protein
MILFSVVVSPVYHIIVSRQVKNPEKIKKYSAQNLLGFGWLYHNAKLFSSGGTTPHWWQKSFYPHQISIKENPATHC